MLNLTLGFLTLFFFLYLSSTKEESNNRKRMHRVLFTASLLLVVSFLALTFCLILRGIISGSIPMTNGYETMILMAWLVMLLSLVAARRAPIALTFGFLLSGFFLLVSHLSQMDPNVSHVMPVLASPLLTIHVSIIMTAYALLSLTFICGISAVITQVLLASKPEKRNQLTTNYQLLSLTFLYPTLTCLGFGIFIGAIWANISWGTYLSWDPKETWALITFMVYGVAVHDRSLSWLRRPMAYHCYIILAFLTLLMTYFGVNYFLGGMHSYA